jgi:hypothetical protein
MQLRELTQALAAGKDVRWGNDGYHVRWAISELKDCYVKEGHHEGA